MNMEYFTSSFQSHIYNPISHAKVPEYVSIILCHYSKVDDFGSDKALGVQKYVDRSAMLRKCLDSLEKNTDYPAEIIVIDNGGNPDDSDYLLSLVRRGVINIYVRNKNNMHFGWAWNQGIALATSETILLTCNDILFKPTWLSQTVEAFNSFPNNKLIASPYISPDKTKHKNPKGMLGKFRLNSMAGSNCMLMTKKIYYEIKPMTTHEIAGSHWHRRMNKLGYLVIVPPEDLVEEMAFRHGLNTKQHIQVKQELLDKTEIDFTFPYTK